MNGLLTETPPSRGPKPRGGAGAAAMRPRRGASGRSRGREGTGGGAGGSRLASAKPINQADFSASLLTGLPNGEESAYESESADEFGSSRQERFTKTDPGNQYEEVRPFNCSKLHKLTFNSSRSNVKLSESSLLNKDSSTILPSPEVYLRRFGLWEHVLICVRSTRGINANTKTMLRNGRL